MKNRSGGTVNLLLKAESRLGITKVKQRPSAVKVKKPSKKNATIKTLPKKTVGVLQVFNNMCIFVP